MMLRFLCVLAAIAVLAGSQAAFASIDGRREALRLCRSDNVYDRVLGARMLQCYRDNEVIAMLMSLLEDDGLTGGPAWKGAALMTYGVREAAYETLVAHGISVEKPVIEPEPAIIVEVPPPGGICGKFRSVSATEKPPEGRELHALCDLKDTGRSLGPVALTPWVFIGTVLAFVVYLARYDRVRALEPGDLPA
jgi:hypothetical protein